MGGFRVLGSCVMLLCNYAFSSGIPRARGSLGILVWLGGQPVACGLLTCCFPPLLCPVVWRDASVSWFRSNTRPTRGPAYQGPGLPGAWPTRGTAYQGHDLPGARPTRGTAYQGHGLPGARPTRGPAYQGPSLTGARPTRGPAYQGPGLPGAWPTRGLALQGHGLTGARPKRGL